MGFILYGVNISDRIDNWLKADNSAVEDLKNKVAAYRASIAEMPTTTSLFVMMGIAFGVVGLSHWGADNISAFMKQFRDTLVAFRLNSLMSQFFLVGRHFKQLLVCFYHLLRLENWRVWALLVGEVFSYLF